MANLIEGKSKATPETRKEFQESIISHVISEAVPKILKKCAGKKTIDDRDIGAEVGWMMDGYKNSDSDIVGRILDFEDYRDWDAFSDHVFNIVGRIARETKEKENLTGNIVQTRSEEKPKPYKQLTQKKLF